MNPLNAATPEGVAPTPIRKPKKKSHKGTGLRIDLSMRESFDLMKLMEAEYTSSGLNDKEFAAYANTKIKLRPGIVIKDHNIGQRRQNMEIKANRTTRPPAAGRSEDLEALAAMVLGQEKRIAALEEQLATVTIWINATFPSKGLKKAI